MWLAWAFAILWVVIFALHLWGTLQAKVKLGLHRVKTNLPPVSILKPLCGLEPNLEETLECFAHLEYSSYEMLLCLASTSDLAYPLAVKMAAKHPNFRVLTGEMATGCNPKIKNLIKGYQLAKYEHHLISDANVVPYPAYLADTMSELLAGNGLVTSVVVGFGSENLAGQVEQLHFNSFVARWMYAANAANCGFPMGVSILYKKSMLEPLGGLTHLKDDIAEDFSFGRIAEKKGVGLCPRPVSYKVGERSWSQVFMRQVRWAILRKMCRPSIFFLEPQQYALIAAAFGALAWSKILVVPWWLFFTTSLAYSAALDLWLAQSFGTETSPHIWLAKEVLMPAVWLKALVTRTIDWRGHKVRIGPGGIGTPV